MCVMIDPTNVPAVDNETLWHPVRELISEERGLFLLRGLERQDIDTMTEALWNNDDIDASQRSAAFLRLGAMAQAFEHPVLRRALMQHGYRHLEAAVKVAAGMHLNADRGFNPRSLAWRISAEMKRRTAELPQPSRAAVVEVAAIAA